jgi:hypothetical protein
LLVKLTPAGIELLEHSVGELGVRLKLKLNGFTAKVLVYLQDPSKALTLYVPAESPPTVKLFEEVGKTEALNGAVLPVDETENEFDPGIVPAAGLI